MKIFIHKITLIQVVPDLSAGRNGSKRRCVKFQVNGKATGCFNAFRQRNFDIHGLALRLGKNYNVVSNSYKTIDAVIQLLDTDNTLTYIAETSGFSSIRYYNKAFTNYLGCLPSKFRSLYKGKAWDATDEKMTMQEFDQISSSPTKQATQTIIRVELQTENQGLCRYTFTGYAEKPQTYTLIIDGAKNLKKGMIMHIDDELNRYLGDMTAHDLSDEVNVFKKMQGIRHEVRYLEASESEVKTTLCGKWYVELYIVVV